MLISLSSLGNLSRFVRQKDRVEPHETVLLLVDGSTISCSGTILAARSSVLEKAVGEHYEIFLDGFEGMLDQVHQCLELLYGGFILVDSDNIIPILRFSVQFEIAELLNLCAVWLVKHDLYQDCGLLTETVQEKKLKLVDKLRVRLKKRLRNGPILDPVPDFEEPTVKSNSDIPPADDDVADPALGDAAPAPGDAAPAPADAAPADVVESDYQLFFSPDLDYVDHYYPNEAPEDTYELHQNGFTPPLPGSIDLDCLELEEMQYVDSAHSSNFRGYEDDNAATAVGSQAMAVPYNDLDTLDFIPHQSPSPSNNITADDYPPLYSKIALEAFPPLASQQTASWQTVAPKKAAKPMAALAPANHYKPSLTKWKKFSIQELERLCGPLCVYPEFVKIEVAIGWVMSSSKSVSDSQALLANLLGAIDPLTLSDKYISTMQEYLDLSRKKLALPPNFYKHVRHPAKDDLPKSKSKFMCYQCPLNERHHEGIQIRGHQSVLIRWDIKSAFQTFPTKPCFYSMVFLIQFFNIDKLYSYS